MDLQDSVQRSLQNPAEKILQICTDSQRSKTWVVAWDAISQIRLVWELPNFCKLEELKSLRSLAPFTFKSCSYDNSPEKEAKKFYFKNKLNNYKAEVKNISMEQ